MSEAYAVTLTQLPQDFYGDSTFIHKQGLDYNITGNNSIVISDKTGQIGEINFLMTGKNYFVSTKDQVGTVLSVENSKTKKTHKNSDKRG